MNIETQHKIYNLINDITILDLARKYEKAIKKCHELEQVIFDELILLNRKLGGEVWKND